MEFLIIGYISKTNRLKMIPIRENNVSETFYVL